MNRVELITDSTSGGNGRIDLAYGIFIATALEPNGLQK
jgi:hypothetical protein